MDNLKTVVTQLEAQSRYLKAQLQRINQAIAALSGVNSTGRPPRSRRRKVSPAALANIRAAQKARWATWRKKRKKRKKR
jgi:hypothetical protein